MGLDVSAYNGIKLIENPPEEWYEIYRNDAGDIEEKYIDKDGVVQPCVYWTERAEDIVADGVYSYENCCHFFSRSYGSYNMWRNQLAQLAGYPAVEGDSGFGTTKRSYAASCWGEDFNEGPFYELINFSDCEGTIGTEVSKKLADDFNKFYNIAMKHEDEYFKRDYERFKECFEFASQNGYVEFG